MNINLKNEIVLHILSVIGAVALTNSVKTKLNKAADKMFFNTKHS